MIKRRIIITIVSLLIVGAGLFKVIYYNKKNMEHTQPTKFTQKMDHEKSGVSLNEAQQMVGFFVTEQSSASAFEDLAKGKPVELKAIAFRYDSDKQTLSMSGLVAQDMKILSMYPAKWEILQNIGVREYTTMMYGEAHFELYAGKIFNADPDVVLLTKTFSEPLLDKHQLTVQSQQLASDATYWRKGRFGEVVTMGKTEDELIKQSPGINEFMLTKQPKSW